MHISGDVAMNSKTDAPEFRLVRDDEVPRYPDQRHYPSLHPSLPIKIIETSCHVQSYIFRGRRYGGVIRTNFVLVPGTNRYIPLDDGWNEFCKLAEKYHKDPKVLCLKGKKRCQKVRSCINEPPPHEHINFYRIDVIFSPVSKELAAEVTFDVFFHAASTYATFVALYVPCHDALVALNATYHRQKGEKKIMLQGDLRRALFEKIKKILAQQVTTGKLGT